MTKRIVYLGPFNNNNKEMLMGKSLEYLKQNKGNKFYYLLPNGELLKLYRKKFIEAVDNTFEINIFTFDDIVNKVVIDIRLDEIGNPMKNAILKDVLRTLSDNNNLKYYKDAINMKGFIKSCNSIIGEVKRSLISPTDYNKKCPNLPAFKEMGKIYEEYENTLNRLNLSDREGDYLKCIQVLKKDHLFLKELDFIIIDEFYDFRPIEIEILKELTKMDISIFINIPFNTESKNPILESTLDNLSKLGFEIYKIEKNNCNMFEDMAAHLFTSDKHIINNIDKFKLIKSNSQELEIKKIFEEIKIHYLDGIQLHDMGIVVTNNIYLDTIFKTAKEEGIPINKSHSISLMDVSLVKEFLNILENAYSFGSKFALINRIKSAYFPIITKEHRESLEYIIRKQKFENIGEFKINLMNLKGINFPVEFIEPLKKCIIDIEDEIKMIPSHASISDYIQKTLNLLKLFDIDNLLLERYKNTDDYHTYISEIKVVEKLRNLINQTIELNCIHENISLEKYYQFIIDYLDEVEIVVETGNSMGLKIFDPVNARGFTNKVIFVLGLSGGSYPNLKGDNYLFKEDNQLFLNSMGVQFKNYRDRINNESLKFSSIISTCSEYLYLSYSGSLQNEGFGIPSIFLDEVFSLLVGEEIEEKLNVINIGLDYLIKDDINKITTNKDLSNFLLYNYFNDKALDDRYFYVHNEIFIEKFANINNKLKCEIGRLNNEFDIYSGKLNDEEIIKDISAKTLDKRYSISYLESYSKCPYYFMMNKYFGIEEMERDYEEYSPIDIGSINHEILKWFYIKYNNDIKKYVVNEYSFPIIDSFKILKIKLEDMFLEYGFEINLKKNIAILESTYEKLTRFILEDLQRLSDPKEKLLPVEFELEFGKKDMFEIEVEDRIIPLVGIIDRIDKLLDREAYLIMDYKSSSYGVRDLQHINSGLSLQLPVYIMANPQLDIVVGLYGIIGSAKFEVPIGILGESNKINKKHKGGLEREEWNQLLENTKINILNIINGIKSGDFSVNPLECSPYCIYKDICRYEKILEVE